LHGSEVIVRLWQPLRERLPHFPLIYPRIAFRSTPQGFLDLLFFLIYRAAAVEYSGLSNTRLASLASVRFGRLVMNSADLIGVIQEQAHPLIEGLYGELRTNLGTSHYHRLSNEELFRRGHAIYQHLSNWLTTRDSGAVYRAGKELGKKRFAEGIPLGQVILALILEEKQLWQYAANMNSRAEEKLKLDVAEFFARFIYSTGLGYEESLAESNRNARRSIVPGKAAIAAIPGSKPNEARQDRQDMATSRGGDVGEFGG